MHFTTFTHALTIGLLAASPLVVAHDNTGALEIAKRFVGGSANVASAWVASARALEAREPHHKQSKGGNAATAGAAANGTATTATTATTGKKNCARDPHHKNSKACARDVEEVELEARHHKGGNAAAPAASAAPATASTAATANTKCARHHKGNAAKACA
ncbi:hypothetical protein BU16DRAFT_584294 [Lophium mytilinum]|uniref:Uncharacterized protein n=1 Tax=Lophium mytilinum TaxID=390894 RepID=A0A6A6QJE4_9PEZI|nr:hypothetical protein BU16DRAFT_584294 [Lophium mytilinum]